MLIKLNEKQEKRNTENMINEIKTLTGDLNITWRLKCLGSVQRKLKYKKVTSLDKIYDIRGIQILCDNVSDCYNVLNIIHKNWNYIPSEVDDYISKPKKNGYRSLHTVIYDSKGITFEIQIMTYEMHIKNQENYQEYKNMKYKKNNIVLQLFTTYLNYLKNKKKLKK
jgi:(p)ppGpp synthase/HD superfamily hydrolase